MPLKSHLNLILEAIPTLDKIWTGHSEHYIYVQLKASQWNSKYSIQLLLKGSNRGL